MMAGKSLMCSSSQAYATTGNNIYACKLIEYQKLPQVARHCKAKLELIYSFDKVTAK